MEKRLDGSRRATKWSLLYGITGVVNACQYDSKRNIHIDYNHALARICDILNESDIDCEGIDEIITYPLTLGYNIYRLNNNGKGEYIQDSDGYENMVLLINFLKEFGDDKFPNLSNAIIELIVDDFPMVNGNYYELADKSNKFDVEKLVSENIMADNSFSEEFLENLKWRLCEEKMSDELCDRLNYKKSRIVE